MTRGVKKNGNLRLTRLRSGLLRHKTLVDPDRSFEQIYRRHRRDVYGSVLRDVRDPDEAEDVTQAAFLNAFRAMRRGDTPERPRVWLITIARNVVRRRARLRSERPREVELDVDSELLLTLDDPDGPASADIHSALERLTYAQREAIVLREIQGRSYAEIALELGLSLSAVEALIFRARRALAEELELVQRVPVVVRRSRRQGLLALPGLSKLGSFGFSGGKVGLALGRASFACLVGCAVIATGPVGDGAATDEPATVKAPTTHELISEAAALEHQAPPVDAVGTRKHKQKSAGDESATRKGPTNPGAQEETDSVVESLPVEVPTVELPPVEVPSVESPVPVPDVPLPPLPEVPDDGTLPPPPSLTS
jgi:RNA polymerase sigma-70 factor, ECF subfamily